ncbi:hypothetical protein EHZ19_28315 [Paraburkholderia bannensis]|nr:hypothetical protein EHZ19_28315 [Paraburkholderia bannensis]
MKERPILFNGPMVRAILDGSKTQTRRIVKDQPPVDCGFVATAVFNPTVIDRKGLEQPGPEIFGAYSEDGSWGCKCPHGAPGERLWLRESFRFTSDFDADSPARVGERCLAAGYKTAWAPIQYDADGSKRDWGWVGTPLSTAQGVTAGRTRASMHMPRWASRITLEVTGVRVERLQQINEADAEAEGFGTGPYYTPRGNFSNLWECIAKPGSHWDANPWVWVVEFKRVSEAA